MISLIQMVVMANGRVNALSWAPTADQINSIKPDQAIGYWSGSVGMIDREWSRRSTLVGIARAFYPNFFDMSKKFV